jgi:hypothetical protein
MNVSIYQSFQDIPCEVRQHLSYPAQPNFFLSYDWFSLLFDTSLSSTLEPRIYVVRDKQEKPVGALFCGIARGSAGAVRQLLNLANFYTLEFSPALAQESDRSTIIRHLIEYIAAERPRWNSIRWTFMNADTDEIRHVLEYFGEADFSAYSYFQYENWYATTNNQSFASYFSERPSQLRNTISRKQKKLAKTHGFEIKIIDHESPELEAAVHDFITIYNSSWKRPEPFPDFIPTLTATCAKLGILRLGLLYVNGMPAAGQIWITTSQKAVIYKLAYADQFRELGVGSILSQELFRIALDQDHVDEIDYGVGSEPYKKDWMPSVRKIEGIEAFNRKTPLGLLLSIREVLKRQSKTWKHMALRRFI